MLLLLDSEDVASVAMERQEAVEVGAAVAAVGSGAQGTIVQLGADRYPFDVAIAADVAVINHNTAGWTEGRVSVVYWQIASRMRAGHKADGDGRGCAQRHDICELISTAASCTLWI